MINKLTFVLLASFALAACNDSERKTSLREKTTGTVQEAVGNITNDKELKNEGKKNTLKGDLRNTKEDIKDAITD